MVTAYGKYPEVENGLQGAPHVRTLVDDVARLVERVAPAHEPERINDAFQLVCTAMHIAYVESS